MSLYKFAEQRWMNSFLETGSLRIGTLYDYNNERKYGSKIGDTKDGIKNFTGQIDQDIRKVREDNVHPALCPLVHLGAGCENVSIRNCHVRNAKVRSPNVFIFSMAHTYSKELHKEWMNDDKAKYNACYEIFDADGLMEAITYKINEFCEYKGLIEVIYRNTVDTKSNEAWLHPAMFKADESYRHQCEVRAIWTPAQEISADHIMVKIKNPQAYCRPFASF